MCRVSFGNSKDSIPKVETLVYETPIPEESQNGLATDVENEASSIEDDKIGNESVG